MKFVLKASILIGILWLSKLAKEPAVAQHKTGKTNSETPVLTQNNISGTHSSALFINQKHTDSKQEKAVLQLN